MQYANGPDAPEYSFNWHDVLAAAKDRKTYFMMMLFWWGGSVQTYSLSYTIPTMVNNLGYSAIKAQALTTATWVGATESNLVFLKFRSSVIFLSFFPFL